MSDAPDPPENDAMPESSDRNPPAAPEAFSQEAGRAPIAAGHTWHGYEIGEPMLCEMGWRFKAVHASMLEEVVIHVSPCSEQTAVRAKAWDELSTLQLPGLVKCREAEEENGFRFEIYAPAPEITLKEWASCRQASIDDVQQLMLQFAQILGGLHERGLVHLNLRPETIYVTGAETTLQIVVGGLENVTVYNQPGLIPIPVDPMYAPPEAAGLSRHQAGAGLRAWDWWTAGRVTQEIVLGRHVLGYLVGRDVSKITPEVKSRAEALLLERDPRAPRAGAVELMPPVNHRLALLMRGLLTSSRDGRWGLDEIERWIAQEDVPHRYQLGRNEELFPWKDRMFTVPEAAEFFSKEENWADGIVNLFATDDRTTLVSFVSERPGYAPVRGEIEELHKFMQVANWAGLSEDVTRAAIAAVVWLKLGPDGSRLCICGRRLDNTCLRGLLTRGSAVNGVQLIRALTAVPYMQMVEKEDTEAARVLSSLAQILNGPVVADAVARGWINPDAEIDYTRLYNFALEAKKKLEDSLRTLRASYACTRDAALQTLFSKTELTLEELVVLACTSANPERHGYVTHRQWNHELQGRIEEQGAQIARILFWLRLRRALFAGWLVTGWWPPVVAVWLLVAAAHGFATALWQGGLTLAGFAALRTLTVAVVNHLVRRFSAGSAPWTWTSRIRRCREEALALAGAGVAPNAHKLRVLYRSLDTQIKALPLDPPPAGLRPPPTAAAGWVAAFAAYLILFGGFWEAVWRTSEVQGPDGPSLEVVRVPTKPAVQPVTEEELFFEGPREARARWDVAPPAEVPSFPLLRTKPANSDQIAAALVDGQKLLLPYARATVDALIAVPIKEKNTRGLLIYDARTRRVVERRLLLPKEIPQENTWFQFKNLRVFYVGEPPVTKTPPPKPEPAVELSDPLPVPPGDLPEKDIRHYPMPPSTSSDH